ncbi:MaoC family dehydratase [Streptomyces sp. 4N509B]|uniref:MaoC family dehydratase n=1 Tax=Streptomyces sp. 4N509B TaxID=3457413 RepID=UPI003FD147FF
MSAAPTVRVRTSPPSLLPSYARAVLPARRGGPGREDVPRHALVLRDVAASPRRVARYAAVCGFPAEAARRTLPATYPHLVAFPAALALMTRRDVPFPVLGLVHLANTVEQRRPIGVAEPLTYHVSLGGARPHPSGVVFDVEAGAETAEGERVWRSVSTYLHRDRRPDRATQARRPSPRVGAPEAEGVDHEPWPVPADTGRRYAAVSGDRNPIHLHPLTSRPFGFRQPIAHGMWAKARCLAALPDPGDAFTFTVEFQRAIRLPARVVLRAHPDTGEFALLPAGRPDAAAAAAETKAEADARPHLTGRVRVTPS